MKLRSFVTLVAAAALAACESGSVLPDRELAGGWATNAQTVQAQLPGGTRTVQTWMLVDFGVDGTFRRMQRLGSETAPMVNAYEFKEEGTYTTANGRITAHVDHAYFRGDTDGTIPTLQPVDYTADFTYTVQGDHLTLVPVCPPNALCAAPRFTEYFYVTIAD